MPAKAARRRAPSSRGLAPAAGSTAFAHTAGHRADVEGSSPGDTSPLAVTELVLNEEIHRRVLLEMIPAARRFVWIATADIKDLHLGDQGRGRAFRPFVATLSDLVGQGIGVRLIHAKEPGPRFRQDFDRYPNLLESDLFERILCPRMHMKCVIVDAKHAFIGSANLTGAGMGAKHPDRRNLEAGIVTDEPRLIDPLMTCLDQFYLGDFCRSCQRRSICPDPVA